MTTNPDISLIVPAYNEASRIANTLLEAVNYFESRNLSYEIIVSVDGTDGTREEAARLASTKQGVNVIGTSQRQGKGRAIREAVKIAQGKYIGFSDADNKTPITELDKFLPLLHQGAEVVIGSRAMSQSIILRPQPLYRRFGSKGFAILMHLVAGLWDIGDTQCGFKFFQQSVAKSLFSHQRIDGYMYDVEILYLAKQYKYGIRQVPVLWADDDDSRLQLVGGNIRNVIDIFRIRFGAGEKGYKAQK